MSGAIQALAGAITSAGTLSASITTGVSGNTTGYSQASFGSITNAALTGGATIVVMVDNSLANTTSLQLSGAAALSQFSFASLTINARVFNPSAGCTFTPGATAQWSWTNGGVPAFGGNPNPFSIA